MFAISEGRILTSKEKSKKEYILKAAETISTTHGNNLGLIHRNTYAEDLELYGLAQEHVMILSKQFRLKQIL